MSQMLIINVTTNEYSEDSYMDILANQNTHKEESLAKLMSEVLFHLDSYKLLDTTIANPFHMQS